MQKQGSKSRSREQSWGTDRYREVITQVIESNDSLMRVPREAGVCNAGQPSVLERQGGRAGADVTWLDPMIF